MRCWRPRTNRLSNGSSVCLWLRARQNLSTEAIAQAVGLSVSHVRRVWSKYLRGGLAAGQGLPKGGRRHQNLPLSQERSLLRPWQQQARQGKLVPHGTSKPTMSNVWMEGA